jgi:hypothetical protein
MDLALIRRCLSFAFLVVGVAVLLPTAFALHRALPEPEADPGCNGRACEFGSEVGLPRRLAGETRYQAHQSLHGRGL